MAPVPMPSSSSFLAVSEGVEEAAVPVDDFELRVWTSVEVTSSGSTMTGPGSRVGSVFGGGVLPGSAGLVGGGVVAEVGADVGDSEVGVSVVVVGGVLVEDEEGVGGGFEGGGCCDGWVGGVVGGWVSGGSAAELL